MSEMVAFMGGTFDPIHNGHLRTALEIRQFLQLERLRLIPCNFPGHRDQPGCSAAQRLEMVRLAVDDEPGLEVDDRELRSPEPSYSINTLASLRQEVGPDASLCMVMGMDSYLTLPSWHRWQELLDLTHILVVQRPGWEFVPDRQMENWTLLHRIHHPQQLRSAPAGYVLLHRLTPLGISATQIRELVRTNQSPRYLIPDRVWRYIREQGLYGFNTEALCKPNR